MALNQWQQCFNRVFIIGGKDVSESQWREVFSKYGEITDILITKDRHTSQKKGVTYISFSKTSEACLACEEMNGRVFPGSQDSRRLKVLIANQRGESNKARPENEEMMLSRLFVKLPEGSTEDSVREYFEQWGHVTNTKLLYDKPSGRAKNLAFVRFGSQYQAALALESCDEEVYRPKFADLEKKEAPPPERSSRDAHYDYGYGSVYDYEPMSRYPSHPASAAASDIVPSPRDMISRHPHNNIMDLEVQVPPNMTQDNLFRLFDIVPGLRSCRLDITMGQAVIRYETPQQAAYAKEKISGMEYPIGNILHVQYYQPSSTAAAAGNVDVKALMETIQKASEALAQAGLGNIASNLNSSLEPTRAPSSSSGVYERVPWCSVPLPPPRPRAPRDAPLEQRLFVVTHRGFHETYLEDAFERFGNMLGAYFVPGRNYGYVKYANKESAREAMEYLHGKELCEQKIKVIWADPPKDQLEPASKKARTE